MASELSYTITLGENDYATLMRLVMLNGTGRNTDESSVSTSVDFRLRIASPVISRIGTE